MENNVRKYIIIPDYKPLWAMARCFGPTHGPLDEPCPTPLDVIRDLLKQDGNDELTIMEVVKEGRGFSTPVKLTSENYMLPYAEIAGGKKMPAVKSEPLEPPEEPVKPVIIPPIQPKFIEPDTAEHNDKEIDLDEVITPVDDIPVVEKPADPYAGMSKSQRRAARKAAAAQEAQEKEENE